MKINPDHMAVCPDWEPPDPRGTFIAMAISGEAGELENLFKKEWRDGVDATGVRRAKMVDELGDVVAYAMMLGQHLGVDIIDNANRQLLAFEQRPDYPELVRKSKERLK